MLEKRNIAVAIILYIVTCGIYGIYWFIKLNDEINLITGDTAGTSGGVAFLFSIITCGIYSYYWMYKMGSKLDNLEVSKGKSSQYRAIVYLVLTFLGFGIVSYALMQDTINDNIA